MAKQRRPFDLSGLRRWETALVALCLAGLLAWYYVGQKESSAVTEAGTAERRAAAARRELASFIENSNIEQLNKELEELKRLPPQEGLPPQQLAGEFAGAVYGKASTLQVTLASLSTKEQRLSTGGLDFFAVVHEIDARGAPEALTKFLSLLNQFDPAVVEALDIGRAGNIAEMRLVVGIPYKLATPAPVAGGGPR